MCTTVQALVFCHVLHGALLTDQLINSVVSRSACFVKHSCSHTWGKLYCVKEEVSASLWGILLTGQQVHDSLTCSLPQLCVCEHVETKWQTTRALGKLGAWWTLVNQKLPAAASVVYFPEKTLKSCLYAAGYWRERAVLFFFFCLSSEKKRPFRLTAPFILYYPAWLLTPGELCSQIDALLLWGCSWNIKLYWNIHMWVHLAESNWCATPQTLNGNVAGPQHALADTLSSGQDSDWDHLSWRLPDSGRLMSVSARWPENIWCCAATWNLSRILGQIKLKMFLKKTTHCCKNDQ